MPINEQLWIIAQSAANEWQYLLMKFCLGAMGCIAVGCAVWGMLKVVTPIMSWTKRHRLESLWLLPFVVSCCLVGMTKHMIGHVTYPYTDVEQRYLIDTGSYVTNDYVHVAFNRSPIVPDSAPLMGAVRPCGSTNDEEWVIFLNTTFEEFTVPQDLAYEGALTNDFQFFTTWTPGPAVHTNGVAVIEWQRPIRPSIHELVTRRTGMYVNGVRLAPNPGLTNGPPITVNLSQSVNQNEGGNE